MAGLLSIGTSGLLAYQSALKTVGHNVANANTEGYSRQRVEFGTQTPQYQGGNFVGTGVRTASIERVYNGFLVNQVQTYTSNAQHAEVFAEHAGLIDGMLADPDVGLTPAMENFFTDLQAVANDPSATAPRQSLLAQSETLVDRYVYMNDRMENIRSQVNNQIEDVMVEINGFADQIAKLNRDIALAPGGSPPNDLLDTRDNILKQLSEKVSISTVEQDNGAVNVFYGSGQLLVMNFDANKLATNRNDYDIRQLEIAANMGGGNFVTVSSQVSGGQLGALFDFRDNVLNESQNKLGSLAIGFATTFNEQHRLGQDLAGNVGGDFFTVPNLEVLPNVNNAATSTAVISATLDDVAELDGAELELSYSTASGYTLRNLSDGSSVNFAATALPYTATDYGFTLSQAGTIQDGDRFLIRPGRRGAQDLKLAVNDASQIAVASPIRTESSILSNTGTGEISPGRVTDATLLPATSLTLRYNSAANNFDIYDSTPALIDTTAGTYANGGSITSTGATLNGLEFSIKGIPNNGDEFIIETNTNGVGDNRNALLLVGLQDGTPLSGGVASYTDFYGGMVADVGVQTKQAQLTETAQKTLLSHAENSRDSLSGVNLDEEAANLVKFQQAYQAASQVIVTSNTLFQSLLAALRG